MQLQEPWKPILDMRFLYCILPDGKSMQQMQDVLILGSLSKHY